MSNKQDLQKALEALAEAKKEELKATAIAIKNTQNQDGEQTELSSRPD